jgi:hypothetical protein
MFTSTLNRKEIGRYPRTANFPRFGSRGNACNASKGVKKLRGTDGDTRRSNSMNRLTLIGLFAAISLPISAQQPQIPTLQVCNLTGGMNVATSFSPLVHIASRAGGAFTGNVNVSVNATCDPVTGFPSGSVVLSNLSMNDSIAQGTISSLRIDQVTSTGSINPTVYISGLCAAQEQSVAGAVQNVACHYWIMVKHDGGPNTPPSSVGGPDIVSFLVFDKTGKRIAYATGPVTPGSGVIAVSPTLN